MTDKLDIFEVLRKVDDFDLGYFNSLTEDQRKTLPAYTLMLWMSGTRSKLQLEMVNTFLNYSVFQLSSHPRLLHKLALVSSDGKPKKYNFVKKKTRSKKFATTIDLLKRRYQCSSKVALEYLSLLELEDVLSIAEDMGEQPDVMKKITKELQ